MHDVAEGLGNSENGLHAILERLLVLHSVNEGLFLVDQKVNVENEHPAFVENH